MAQAAEDTTRGAVRRAERSIRRRLRGALPIAALTSLAAAFLAHQLMAWPPHEDEALALFVGRDTLGGVIGHVTTDRGGAPLHFLLAWAVAQLGLGLGGLRAVSLVFAVGSLPLVFALASRLVSRREALLATTLLAGSWIFLFHGVYGRMYSAFLFFSVASFLALLRALEPGRRGWWPVWAGTALLSVATHPYGALVLAAQGGFVALAHRERLRAAAVAFGSVLVLGIPFWLTDLVLAGRFDVGVGGGGEALGGPVAVLRYLWRSAGDFTAGWWPALMVVLALAAVGLGSLDRIGRRLTLAVVAIPTIALLATRLGGSASPESRHLIFVAPFLSIAVAAGAVRVTRRVPPLALVLVAGLLVAEVSWAWHRVPALFEWEPDARQVARVEAESYLAGTSRRDDVLLGYEPLYLGAWERNPEFTRIVLPRADATLALRRLREQDAPLGRGVWVLDASRRNNPRPRLEIERASPTPTDAFVVRRFGPFLVLRTAEPTRTPQRYLELASRAMLLGRQLGIGDADVNLQTLERAGRELRGYGPSLRLRSIDSR